MNLLCYLTSSLKNAIQSHKKFIFFPKNSFCLNFLQILFKEGLLSQVSEVNSGKFLKIQLKYKLNGTPGFKDIRILSTPGNSRFLSYKQLAKLDKGIGILVLSTNQGLLTSEGCLKQKIGGTSLCYII